LLTPNRSPGTAVIQPVLRINYYPSHRQRKHRGESVKALPLFASQRGHALPPWTRRDFALCTALRSRGSRSATRRGEQLGVGGNGSPLRATASRKCMSGDGPSPSASPKNKASRREGAPGRLSLGVEGSLGLRGNSLGCQPPIRLGHNAQV